MGYVYMIINTVNQKKYIGISIHEPEKRRIKAHLSGRGNQLLASAVKKYGKDAFTYEILEANVFDEFLPELEVAYIAQFNTVAPHGYNLNSGGNHAIPTEETRRKLSEGRKGENHPFFGKQLPEVHRRKISEALKGRKCTADTLRKMSAANKGENHPFFGKTHTAAARRKISETHTGRRHTAAARRKISKSLKGRKLTEAHRRKLSESHKGIRHTAAARRKISEAHKGRTFSEATLRKMSEASMHPDHAAAREFFFSLPLNMPLTAKRKLLLATFSNVSQTTIYRWVKKWQSSD